MEQFDSRLSNGRKLAADLVLGARSLVLDAIPSPPPLAGTYRLRIEGEIVTGQHSGRIADATFTDLARGLEGTSDSVHYAGVTVRHVITGGSLSALREDAVGAAQSIQGPSGPDPRLYARSVGERLFLAQNFS